MRRVVPIGYHDFEEIQKANIFSDELIWNSSQEGPVGRFDIDGLEVVKGRISELYANNPESEIHALIKEPIEGSLE